MRWCRVNLLLSILGGLAALSLCACGPAPPPAGPDEQIADEEEPGFTEERFTTLSGGKVLSVGLLPPEHESRTARIFVNERGWTRKWDVGGFYRWFGLPCTIGAGNSQIFIVPCYLGGGTGVGYFDWMLIWWRSEDPVFQNMGTWESYWVGWGPRSYQFWTYPDLIRRSSRGESMFNFVHILSENGRDSVSQGSLVLREVGENRDEPMALIPQYLSDAEVCIKLLSSPSGVPYWAAERLATICPDEVRRYEESADRLAGERDKLLDQLREAVRKFYQDPDKGASRPVDRGNRSIEKQWFMAQTGGRILSVYLEPSVREPQPGRIIVKREGRTWEWKTGFARSFCSPCGVGAGEDQILIIPYYGGGGTGDGEVYWVLLRWGPNGLLFQEMGPWRCWSESSPSCEFSINRDLTGWGSLDAGRTLLHVFDFAYTSTEKGQSAALSGRLILLEVDGGESKRMALIPQHLSDAEACAKLLSSPLEPVRQWAAERLMTLSPDDLQRYEDGWHRHVEEKIEKLNEIKKLVDKLRKASKGT